MYFHPKCVLCVRHRHKTFKTLSLGHSRARHRDAIHFNWILFHWWFIDGIVLVEVCMLTVDFTCVRTGIVCLHDRWYVAHSREKYLHIHVAMACFVEVCLFIPYLSVKILVQKRGYASSTRKHAIFECKRNLYKIYRTIPFVHTYVIVKLPYPSLSIICYNNEDRSLSWLYHVMVILITNFVLHTKRTVKCQCLYTLKSAVTPYLLNFMVKCVVNYMVNCKRCEYLYMGIAAKSMQLVYSK